MTAVITKTATREFHPQSPFYLPFLPASQIITFQIKLNVSENPLPSTASRYRCLNTTTAMFKRVVVTAPRVAGRVLSTTARPGVSPPARIAAPAAINARRSYHEKDMFLPSLQSLNQLYCPGGSVREHVIYPLYTASVCIDQNPQLT